MRPPRRYWRGHGTLCFYRLCHSVLVCRDTAATPMPYRFDPFGLPEALRLRQRRARLVDRPVVWLAFSARPDLKDLCSSTLIHSFSCFCRLCWAGISCWAVAAIHVFVAWMRLRRDARHKAGHHEFHWNAQPRWLHFESGSEESALARVSKDEATVPQNALIAQARARVGAEHRDSIDGEHHREGDDEHRDTENGNRGEIAAFIQVVDQHTEHLGLRRE